MNISRTLEGLASGELTRDGEYWVFQSVNNSEKEYSNRVHCMYVDLKSFLPGFGY